LRHVIDHQARVPHLGPPDQTPASAEPATAWTVGHSTLDIEAFIAELTPNGIALVGDVRRFPGSRRHPQFGAAALERSLAAAGVAYVPFTELGGRRTARPDSPNTAWRNAAFRGYADYMATPEFAEGFARLVRVAHEHRTAVMCAEALWFRCHRSLIADAYTAAGGRVLHIGQGGRVTEHPMTSAARIVDGRLVYRKD
jgi:uncharacterized protein (DUF488 family)